MSLAILIMGESGAGKTTSLRNLDPKTTLYIDADKKGLSWRGWKKHYSEQNKNYLRTSSVEMIMKFLGRVDMGDMKHINTVVIDTLNGIMVDDEMARVNEKSYDKWVDLAASVYGIITRINDMRDGLTVICTGHTQTDADDNGYVFTHLKTSGRKLNKIVLESKFTTVLWAKCVDGQYVFETRADHSTAKTPMGAFGEKVIPNDIMSVIKTLKEFEMED